MRIRNGKIARLPREIREQLNQRLADGAQGPKLIRWLNGLPEVRHTMADGFDGKPVSEQNLSEWRTGGFREWLARQEALEQARELAADADELQEATRSRSGDHRLSDHLATLLTILCAKLLTDWKGEASREFKQQLRVLRGMAHDIASLARVGVERQRLELIREKSQGELVDLFNEWIEIPEVREVVCDNHISPEERRRIIAQVYGRAVPEEEEAAVEAGADGPPEGFRSAKTATSQGGSFGPNPLESKRSKKRWLKDPTGSEDPAREAQRTPEERRQEIRRIYGLPEEGPNVGLAPNQAQSESIKPKGQGKDHPAAANPLPKTGASSGGDAGAGSSGIQGQNQTESESIKPIGVKPTTSKSGYTEEENRRWRIEHHFEVEDQPGGENPPPDGK